MILDAHLIIELPKSLTDCRVSEMKLPLEATDIFIGGFEQGLKTVQHEGCGLKGHRILLPYTSLTTISDAAGKNLIQGN